MEMIGSLVVEGDNNLPLAYSTLAKTVRVPRHIAKVSQGLAGETDISRHRELHSPRAESAAPGENLSGLC